MYNNYIAVDSDNMTATVLCSEKDVTNAVQNGCTIYACGDDLLDGDKEIMYSPKTGWETVERPSFVTTNTLRFTDEVESDIQYLSMMTGIDLYPEVAMFEVRAKVTKSKNFDRVKDFYINDLWNLARVQNAIGLWITEEEYSEIIGGD